MSDKRIDPALIFVAVIALVLVGLGFFIFLQVRTDAISSRTDADQVIPVLLTVSDNNSPVLSQVLLIEPKTKRVAIVEIPSNLGSLIGSLGRVDSLEVLFHEKGVQEYQDSISKLIDLSIPFRILLTKDQLVSLVDLVGGLPVFVADSIDYSGDNEIVRVPNGNVNLDGEKTLAYITYSDKSERDQDQSNRRWGFTKAFLQRLGEQESRIGNGRFLSLLHKQFQSNLDERAFANLVELISKTDSKSLVTQRIIGNTRIVDTQEGTKSLLFPHFEGQLVKDSVRQVLANLSSKDDLNDGSGMVRVEILNGTNSSGLAQKTKELFQSYGFDVINVGNATSTDVQKTQIIDRKGNAALAQRAAKIIKCLNITTQIESTPASNVDVTIVLGKDFDGWNVKAN